MAICSTLLAAVQKPAKPRFVMLQKNHIRGILGIFMRDSAAKLCRSVRFEHSSVDQLGRTAVSVILRRRLTPRGAAGLESPPPAP
jgi:hypothetical protein